MLRHAAQRLRAVTQSQAGWSLLRPAAAGAQGSEAAAAARSYSAETITLEVRLPVPSWLEVRLSRL